MEFLGVGPLELLFIFIIALIVLGPKDLVKAAGTLGRFLRKIWTSSFWQELGRIRTLPNQLAREAGFDETVKEIREGLPNTKEINQVISKIDIQSDIQKAKTDLSPWTTPPAVHPPPTPTLIEPTQLPESKTAAIQNDDKEASRD